MHQSIDIFILQVWQDQDIMTIINKWCLYWKNWRAYIHQQNLYQILNFFPVCILVFKKPSIERIHIRIWLPYLKWQYIIYRWNKLTMTFNKVLTMSYDSKYGLIKDFLYVSIQCYQCYNTWFTNVFLHLSILFFLTQCFKDTTYILLLLCTYSIYQTP